MISKQDSAKRGLRRQAARRMKAKALRIYPHDPKARLADHLAQCSCHMCGNERRHFGNPTVQEKRAAEAAKRDIADSISGRRVALHL